MTPLLPRVALDAILEHAKKEFPRECCGFVVRHDRAPSQIVRGRNVMDELHRRDPAKYPRTAEDAYAVDVATMIRLGGLLGRGGLVHAVYHSHTHHDGANLSDDDVRGAVRDGRPTFPYAWQIVVSITATGPTLVHGYLWDRNHYVLAGAVRIADGTYRQVPVLPLIDTRTEIVDSAPRDVTLLPAE